MAGETPADQSRGEHSHFNELSSLSGELLDKARLELNEDPDTRHEAIEELRERIAQWRPSRTEEKSMVLSGSAQDSKFLLMFLRARKFDLDKALQLYVNYHLFRHKHADILRDLSFKSVEHVLHSQVIRVLDARCRDGSRALCVSPANWDSASFPFLDNFRATFLVLDRLIQEEETQVNGFSVLYDFTGSSLMNMLKVAQSDLITKGVLIELLQEAFPARFKGVHLLHQPWYISIVLSVIKPFMKQKLRERIHSHGENSESLHRYVDPLNLPPELGGTGDWEGGQEGHNATYDLFESVTP